MLRQFIWTEVLAGFNEDSIISNKPNSLYKALNVDLEKQQGSLRKRKGYQIFGSQIVDNNDMLGLFDFVKDGGSHVPLSLIDDTIAITNASYSDPTVTLTVGSSHGIVAGDTIVVSGLVPTGYNGEFTVTEVGETSIKYSKESLAALSTTTGTITISKLMYYSSGWTLAKKGFTPSIKGRFEKFIGYCFFTNGEQLRTSSDGITWGTTNLKNTVNITAVSYDDPTITLTVATGHGVEVGDSIVVASLAPSGYNGTFTVTAVTSTTIAYSVASLEAVSDQVGTLTIQFSLAANDVVEYGNSLFLIGLNGYESDIMWSEIPYKNDSGVYEIEWNRENNVSVNIGDGEELIAGVEYRGAFYLFKNSSISRTIVPIASNGIKSLTKNIGANGKDCIQVVSGQMIFFNDGIRNSKKGFYSFNSLSDAEPQIISEPMQPYIDGMTAGQVVVSGVINDLYIAYIGAVSNAEHNISMSHCYLVFNAKTDRWLGVWEYSHASKIMSHLTVSNVTNLYFGDDDGTVWKTNEGNRDGYVSTEITGSPITLDVISHPYDLSQGGKGFRDTYTKRKVKNMYIVGDKLENCKFSYRFDKKLSEKTSWEKTCDMRSPVSEFPIKKQDTHLFQYRITHIGDNDNEPIIRKLILENE
jgi:hypothetical protein